MQCAASGHRDIPVMWVTLCVTQLYDDYYYVLQHINACTRTPCTCYLNKLNNNNKIFGFVQRAYISGHYSRLRTFVKENFCDCYSKVFTSRLSLLSPSTIVREAPRGCNFSTVVSDYINDKTTRYNKSFILYALDNYQSNSR